MGYPRPGLKNLSLSRQGRPGHRRKVGRGRMQWTPGSRNLSQWRNPCRSQSCRGQEGRSHLAQASQVTGVLDQGCQL